MSLTPLEWHARFRQQAGWTRQLRHYLYRRAGLDAASRVLEAGCGSGALLAEFEASPSMKGPHHLFGLDLNPAFLSFAGKVAPQSLLSQGDAHQLPFRTASFDASLCHFLLLWVQDPQQVVNEFVRVTRPGGAVFALAEPDYGGRIDFPIRFSQLGEWQQESLRLQGADTQMGRRLAAIFYHAGLVEIESGVLGGQWTEPPSAEALQEEWNVLWDDFEILIENRLKDLPPGAESITTLDMRRKIEQLQEQDALAWQSGERILFVPTFYAWGRVPS